MAELSHSPGNDKGSLSEIAKEFLRFGLIAYGGAAAHIAMMEQIFVQRLGWLSRERFLDLVGAVNLLPGPTSTELAIYIGEIRGGLPGLFIAGACFILPAAVLVVALAWAYVKYGALPNVEALLYGVKAVVVSLIFQAIWNLARSALKTPFLVVLVALVLMLAFLGLPVVLLLIASGLVCVLLRTASTRRLAAASPVALILQSSAAIPSVGLLSIFLYFLKVGAVIFGSGYVLLAFMRADLVIKLHWLTDTQLLDAIAISQATPGPFFTVSTFIGYVLAGWKGAILGTIGMFVPAFTYVAATASFLPKLRKSPTASAFLDGVNAAVIALMAYVGWQFARAAIVNVQTLLIALVGAVLLLKFKLNSAWLVLGAAALGILLHVLGWA
jgi:chromate transporter